MLLDPRLIEPFAVPDVFVSGLSSVEHLGGGVYRFTCYTKQRSIHDGCEEKVVTLRIIMPLEAIPTALFKTAEAIGYEFIPKYAGKAH